MSEESFPDHGYVIHNRVGRLVEARVYGLRAKEDADAYARDFGIALMRIPRDVRPILCADHRPVAIYSQPVADRLIEMFTGLNPRLERVAILVARSNASLVLQLQRIVREAQYTARRVFHDAEQAQAHLAPVLEPDELSRVRTFLDELRPASSYL